MNKNPSGSSDRMDKGDDSEPPLPPGWVRVVSRNANKVYYYHKARGISQWKRPTSTFSNEQGKDGNDLDERQGTSRVGRTQSTLTPVEGIRRVAKEEDHVGDIIPRSKRTINWRFELRVGEGLQQSAIGREKNSSSRSTEMDGSSDKHKRETQSLTYKDASGEWRLHTVRLEHSLLKGKKIVKGKRKSRDRTSSCQL